MANIGRICKKRLLGDVRMLKKDPHQYFEAIPDEENILIWYFLLRTPSEFTEYRGGHYIGKIIHNPEYPFKPPDFMMLTPSGRFLTDKKICLSNSSYHSNEWSAMWNIKSILTGFLSIMLDDQEHGISHIKRSTEERQFWAKESIKFNKENYPEIIKRFTRFLDENGDPVENKNESEKEEKYKDGPIDGPIDEPKDEPKNTSKAKAGKKGKTKSSKKDLPIKNFDKKKVKTVIDDKADLEYKKIMDSAPN